MMNQEHHERLKEKANEQLEKDEALFKAKEKKRLQHEEQLFMIDLEKAQDAELSKGLADKLYDREIK